MMLANVELMLLELVGEQKKVSGYAINKLVTIRGYREWAAIGPTSIYVGLNKLKEKQLVKATYTAAKKGKGPPAQLFALTPRGRRTLKREITAALAKSRERDKRFDLGLAGLPFIQPAAAIVSLVARRDFLKTEVKRLQRKFRESGGRNLPLQARKLFEHPLALLKEEINFNAGIITALRRQKRKGS